MRAEEHQEVVGNGKEEGQTRESGKHSGEPVKNPPSRNCVTDSERQTAIMDMCWEG